MYVYIKRAHQYLLRVNIVPSAREQILCCIVHFDCVYQIRMVCKLMMYCSPLYIVYCVLIERNCTYMGVEIFQNMHTMTIFSY
jgi:hypothetical protein